MSNGKGMIIVLIVGLIKKTLYKNESILFLNHLIHILVTVYITDLSNYATKTDINNASHVDKYFTSFALKTNLATLQTELDIAKLVPIPVDLSKLSDVVKK